MSADLFAADPATAAQLDAARDKALEAKWAAEIGSKPGTCRSCPARLRWALTEAGEWMPIEQDPDPAGIVTARRSGRAVIATVHPVGSDLEGLRWTAHFANCPAAAEHRRPRR